MTRPIAVAAVLAILSWPLCEAWTAEPAAPEFTIQLDTVRSGFDGKTCWVAPRAAAIPPPTAGGPPTIVITMQELLLVGSDVFYGVNDMHSTDLGRTWTGPTAYPQLRRRSEPGGAEIVMGDCTPKWHAKTGKVLGIGTSVRYRKNAAGIDVKISQNESPARAAYSAYDPQTRTWSAWDMLVMPDDPKFFYATVGSSQRVDLPDGDILMPIHFKTAGESPYHTTVTRCRFDGKKLTYLEHGTELSRPAEPGVVYKEPGGRQTGVFEPSLTLFQGKYYLTMRNDRAAYVAVSDDGLHYGPVRRWRFDDGEDLGSRNTQQHWVAHSDGLFLVYTRVGANNDHVFRNRAPIFIARVDPEKLVVLRKTEQILVPERGAGLGTAFGVCEVSENESWVTTAEWMQGPKGILQPGNQYGSDNSIFAARILWKTPNRTAK
jgi:hypothetical protein